MLPEVYRTTIQGTFLSFTPLLIATNVTGCHGFEGFCSFSVTKPMLQNSNVLLIELYFEKPIPGPIPASICTQAPGQHGEQPRKSLIISPLIFTPVSVKNLLCGNICAFLGNDGPTDKTRVTCKHCRHEIERSRDTTNLSWYPKIKPH